MDISHSFTHRAMHSEFQVRPCSIFDRESLSLSLECSKTVTEIILNKCVQNKTKKTKKKWEKCRRRSAFSLLRQTTTRYDNEIYGYIRRT